MNKIVQLLLVITTALIATQSYAEDEAFDKNVNALKNYHYQIATVARSAPSKLNFYKNATVAEGFCPSPMDSELYVKDDSVSATNCPAMNSQCALKTFLVPNNKVVVSKQYKDFSCVWYPNKNTVAYGWVPTKFLTLAPVKNSKEAWLGKWRDSNGEMTFSKDKSSDQFIVNGNATWAGDGEGNVNEGTLENEKITVDNNEAQLTQKDSECRVFFKLLDANYLSVLDNGNCGGVNVSFSGIYTKGNK